MLSHSGSNRKPAAWSDRRGMSSPIRTPAAPANFEMATLTGGRVVVSGEFELRETTSTSSSRVADPYVAESAERTREPLYAA
jgi:hypothetical protein